MAVCPQTGAPPGWPGCANSCPDPPDVNKAACQRIMPCPKPADRRVAACKLKDFAKCADINNPDPDNPNCDHAVAAPVTGRVIHNEIQGSDTLITISAGRDRKSVV